MSEQTLAPAAEVAAENPIHFPNESPDYREARRKLLAEEIELRRHIERVAELRRKLPPGGEVTETYHFKTEDGPATLADLFGDRDTLVLYSYMFGPQRSAPCPMCTSFMKTWDHKIADLQQRVSIGFVARSPIARLVEDRDRRGFTHLPVISDPEGAYTRAYIHPEDADVPGYAVFTRRDGTIRHFWSSEMSVGDPGQDPRGAPDLDPLWAILDTTPEGRGATWYPRLTYGS